MRPLKLIFSGNCELRNSLKVLAKIIVMCNGLSIQFAPAKASNRRSSRLINNVSSSLIGKLFVFSVRWFWRIWRKDFGLLVWH